MPKLLGTTRNQEDSARLDGAGAMRSTDEGAAVSSSLLNLDQVPLEQILALAPATLDEMVQRGLPRSPAAPAPSTAFSSYI